MKVAVALVLNEAQDMLITRRAAHASHAGLWEFPGGKLEKDELASTALIRELKEEVGIEVLNYQYLGSVSHDYETGRVELLIFLVDQFLGEASCCELQTDLRWISLDKLNDYEFPKANHEIIELIVRHKNIKD